VRGCGGGVVVVVAWCGVCAVWCGGEEGKGRAEVQERRNQAACAVVYGDAELTETDEEE
jgi:hypothetical protein